MVSNERHQEYVKDKRALWAYTNINVLKPKPVVSLSTTLANVQMKLIDDIVVTSSSHEQWWIILVAGL